MSLKEDLAEVCTLRNDLLESIRGTYLFCKPSRIKLALGLYVAAFDSLYVELILLWCCQVGELSRGFRPSCPLQVHI